MAARKTASLKKGIAARKATRNMSAKLRRKLLLGGIMGLPTSKPTPKPTPRVTSKNIKGGKSFTIKTRANTGKGSKPSNRATPKPGKDRPSNRAVRSRSR